MHPTLEKLEQVLRSAYDLPHQARFVNNARFNPKAMDLAGFVATLGHPLPQLFIEFYGWLRDGPLPEPSDIPNSGDLPSLEERWQKQDLGQLARATEAWRQLKAEQPEQAWHEGFVELAAWDGTCSLHIDTLGVVGPVGNLLWWDYRNEESTYNLQYPSFDSYLRCHIELLEAGLFFMPPDQALEEDFLFGTTRKQIEAIEQAVNGPTLVIDGPR